ncbi:MAG: hypothetical protein WA764_18070, partial [Pseudolabrys sp.]
PTSNLLNANVASENEWAGRRGVVIGCLSAMLERVSDGRAHRLSGLVLLRCRHRERRQESKRR